MQTSVTSITIPIDLAINLIFSCLQLNKNHIRIELKNDREFKENHLLTWSLTLCSLPIACSVMNGPRYSIHLWKPLIGWVYSYSDCIVMISEAETCKISQSACTTRYVRFVPVMTKSICTSYINMWSIIGRISWKWLMCARVTTIQSLLTCVLCHLALIYLDVAQDCMS